MKYYYEAEMMLELLAERGCTISPLLIQLEEDQFDDVFTDKEKGENNYKLFVEFLKFADLNEIYYFDDVLELMKDKEDEIAKYFKNEEETECEYCDEGSLHGEECYYCDGAGSFESFRYTPEFLEEATEIYEDMNYETKVMKLAEAAYLKNGSPESVMKMIKLKTMFA